MSWYIKAGDKEYFTISKHNSLLTEEVTESWKIMLLELGRKTPEFKPNDVIVTHQDLYLAGYHDHDEIVLLFEENLVIRFCPEEHSIEV